MRRVDAHGRARSSRLARKVALLLRPSVGPAATMLVQAVCSQIKPLLLLLLPQLRQRPWFATGVAHVPRAAGGGGGGARQRRGEGAKSSGPTGLKRSPCNLRVSHGGPFPVPQPAAA